jgi:hypothetical protein
MENDLEYLKAEILDKMHKDIKIRPDITWVKPNTIERFNKKTAFIEKRYE